MTPTPESRARAWRQTLQTQLIQWGPATLRAAVGAVCTGALVAHIGSPFLQGVAALLAVIGMIAGQFVGRSALRPAALVAALSLGVVGAWLAAGLLTSSSVLVSVTTPGGALGLASVLRIGSVVVAVTLGLRAAATRAPAWSVAELAAMAIAVASLFAAHRDGMVVRPLWFSDLAAASGWEPVQALLAVGGVLGVALASLLVVETRRRVSLASAIALPVIALLAWSIFRVADLPTPDDPNDLGLTERTDSDEWNAQDAGMEGQGGGPEEQGEESGEGGEEEEADGGGASGQDAGEDGGGASGEDAGEDGGGGGASSEDAGEDGGGGASSEADTSQQPSGSSGASEDPSDSSESESSSSEPPPPQPPNFDSSPPDRSNPSPMAVVVLGDDYEPPMQAFYFRQESWSQFNGSRLVPAVSGYDNDLLTRFPMVSTPIPEAPPATAERTLVRHTVALLVDHVQPLALESPARFIPAINPDPQRFRRAYNVESLALAVGYGAMLGRAVGDPAWSPEERAHYLEGPDDVRFLELANEITAALPPEAAQDPWARALAIKVWLDQNLIYSTQHQHAASNQPAADFLFGDRTGYCVHIAHAAVFLWRSIGIPSRVSSGYMVPSENRRGSNVLLTSSDAHAWPEIWVEGLGWVVLDVTPEQVLDEPVPPTDEELTIELGEMARQQPESPAMGDDAEQDPERPSLGQWLWSNLPRWLLFGLMGLYLVKLWRRLAPWWASPTALPHVAYRRALDELSDLGLQRPDGMTRERWARSLADRVPALQRLTQMHNDLRFGDLSRLHPWGRAEWIAALKALESDLERGWNLRQRALRALHPFSFFFSR